MLGKLETINSIPAIFLKPNTHQGGSRTSEAPKTELFNIDVTVSSLHLLSQGAPFQMTQGLFIHSQHAHWRVQRPPYKKVYEE